MAGQVEEGDERRHGGEGGGKDGQGDLGGAEFGRLFQILTELAMAMDVVQHHDGIVHQHTEAQSQTSKGEQVQPDPGKVEQVEGQEDREEDRRQDYQRGDQAVQEGEKNQEDHQDREGRAGGKVGQLAADALALIALFDQAQAGGKAVLQLGQPPKDAVGHLDDVGPRLAFDGEHHGWIAVDA